MNKLDEIFAYKREKAAERSTLLGELRVRAEDQSAPRGFFRALQGAAKRPSLIAEVKKASPVAGMIREDFDPTKIARSYERAGAACLSVLTDLPYFQGSEENLRLARGAVSLPVLRKDFTVGELDVFEARAMGADAILLIVYGLDDAELLGLRQTAEGLGMDVIVEAHSDEECERALASGATLLGINNRDLKTFETSVSVGETLIPKYADQAFVISESALHSFADVQRVVDAGAQAVLIGTAFCSRPNIEEGVAEVMGWSGSKSVV